MYSVKETVKLFRRTFWPLEGKLHRTYSCSSRSSCPVSEGYIHPCSWVTYFPYFDLVIRKQPRRDKVADQKQHSAMQVTDPWKRKDAGVGRVLHPLEIFFLSRFSEMLWFAGKCSTSVSFSPRNLSWPPPLIYNKCLSHRPVIYLKLTGSTCNMPNKSV